MKQSQIWMTPEEMAATIFALEGDLETVLNDMDSWGEDEALHLTSSITKLKIALGKVRE